MIIIIAAIILALALILFIPLKADVSYKEKKIKIDLAAGPFRIKMKKADKVKKKAPAEGEKKAGNEKKLSFDDGINLLSALYESSRAIRRTVKVEKLELSALYGSGDAAATGFLLGIAYAEIYKFIGLVSCIFTVNPPVITISPCYEDEPKFNLEFELRVKTNAAKALYTAVKFYKKYKSYNKRKG